LELLEVDRKRFYEVLATPKEQIDFYTFEDDSKLDYLFGLLNHYESVCSDDKLRSVIEAFQAPYVDFYNEVVYNKSYYEMFKICLEKDSLDAEQKRIIEKTIRNFEVS
jgi:Zn-dependent oligopeptidase